MIHKTLFLIRGLPGSGKTTLARMLCDGYYAADDYFTDIETGEYKFDPSRIRDAHQWCQRVVEDAMKLGEHHLAVHNTFSEPWEAKPYFEMADRHGYSVFIIECQNCFENTHEVPPETIGRMRERWTRLTVEAPSP